MNFKPFHLVNSFIISYLAKKIRKRHIMKFRKILNWRNYHSGIENILN